MEKYKSYENPFTEEEVCVVDLSCGDLKASVLVGKVVLEKAFSVNESTMKKGLAILASSLIQNYLDLEGKVPKISLENLRIEDIHYQQ